MDKTAQPNLSPGNHIYLYRLLRDAIGVGKQTLMPNVEAALEAERLGAEDLGFACTRDLLEALDDFIKLTVFKGGRIYATVIAQPAWDEALAAPAKQPASGSAKSWKRKKADKSLKPVRPKRVKRERPVEGAAEKDASEPAARTDAPAPAADAPDAAGAADAPAQADSAPEGGDRPDADATAGGPADDGLGSPAASEDVADAGQPEAPACGSDAGASAEPEAPQPSISLTVIYDPENANGGVTTLASTPGAPQADIAAVAPEAAVGDGRDARPEGAASASIAEPEQGTAGEPTTGSGTGAGAPRADETDEPRETDAAAASAADAAAAASPADPAAAGAQTATEPAASPVAQAPARSAVAASSPAQSGAAPSATEQPGVPTERMLAGYPDDFSCEVYCPSALLGVAMSTLPLGVSAMDALCSAYARARADGTIRGTRTRFSFELPMDNGCNVLAEVRRKGGHGSDWAVQSLSYSMKG